DNLQDLGGSSLTLQRFGQIICALAQLVEQPRVLDGDDGLISEARDQRDLLVSKGTDFLTIKRERTDQFVLLYHWNAQERSHTPEFNGVHSGGSAHVRFVCRKIDNMGGRFRLHHATHTYLFGGGSNRRLLACLGEGRWRVMRSKKVQKLAVPAVDIAELGIANTHSLVQHGLKHRLKSTRRVTDDLKHL